MGGKRQVCNSAERKGPESRNRGESPVAGRRKFCKITDVSTTAEPQVTPDTGKKDRPEADLDPGYLVICWDDPVNLMDYVTHVFQKVFGWPRAKAEKHMMEVHTQGRSVLVRAPLERAEHYVHQLQRHALHASLEREP